jgi:hypothetical protein
LENIGNRYITKRFTEKLVVHFASHQFLGELIVIEEIFMKNVLSMLAALIFGCTPKQSGIVDIYSDLSAGISVLISPDYVGKLVEESPNVKSIENVVNELSWNDITFVVLKMDSTNWIEFSGSKYDGLSLQYREGEKIYVTTTPPESIEDGITVLSSYLSKTDFWKSKVGWR